jgi:hypothetical protein
MLFGYHLGAFSALKKVKLKFVGFSAIQLAT